MEASSTIIDRFGIHDKPEEIDRNYGWALNILFCFK